MDADDLDRLEQQMREALAIGLRSEASKDPAWGLVRAALAPRYESDELAQNGTSSWFRPLDDRDIEF